MNENAIAVSNSNNINNSNNNNLKEWRLHISFLRKTSLFL